jgi:hypothetical protein
MIRDAPQGAVYGIDLGKNIFHVVGIRARVKFRCNGWPDSCKRWDTPSGSFRLNLSSPT